MSIPEAASYTKNNIRFEEDFVPGGLVAEHSHDSSIKGMVVWEAALAHNRCHHGYRRYSARLTISSRRIGQNDPSARDDNGSLRFNQHVHGLLDSHHIWRGPAYFEWRIRIRS